MLTSFTSKHRMPSCENERTPTLLPCQNLALPREGKHGPPVSRQSSGVRLHAKPRSPDGPRRIDLRGRENPRPVHKGLTSVTVCAAVLCDVKQGPEEALQFCLAVSDRMITCGDHEFESRTTKVFVFAPAIIGLCAGDTDLHTMIATSALSDVINNSVSSVHEVARLYAQHFAVLRRRRAEETYLAPLGLDASSFIARQQEMEASQVSLLTQAMLDARLDVEAIIAGADDTGSHIYRIGDPGQALCCDRSGFCAIGPGWRQFETQFMLAGYCRDQALLDALLLTYSAKKKAEVAPGVGSATDLAMIHRHGAKMVSESDYFFEQLSNYHLQLEALLKQSRNKVLADMGQGPAFAWCRNPAPDKP